MIDLSMNNKFINLLNKQFIYYCSNINYIINDIDPRKNKIICLYDSNENMINKIGFINHKCNLSTLNNLHIFVSNKRSINIPPIIILNNLSVDSINLVKKDYVLMRPKSFNISLIIIGINNIFENL
jgi:hypothetical protein